MYIYIYIHKCLHVCLVRAYKQFGLFLTYVVVVDYRLDGMLIEDCESVSKDVAYMRADVGRCGSLGCGAVDPSDSK